MILNFAIKPVETVNVTWQMTTTNLPQQMTRRTAEQKARAVLLRINSEYTTQLTQSEELIDSI